MSGLELVKAARQRRPDLPVALTTGHSDVAGHHRIVRKPLIDSELIHLRPAIRA